MRRVVIMGAAGRDFHDFNTVFRNDSETRVVAFTAAPGQNLGELGEPIERYPAALAGPGYPEGIPVVPEADLESVLREEDVDEVVFSYSDVSHEHVMHAASRAESEGADFRLLGPDAIQLDPEPPVLAVDAVRTGCGKSPVALALADALQERGVEPAVVREPMPYGDLVERRVQRFADREDVEAANLTIEEREEYEDHVERGHLVFAGVDYAEVFDAAADAGDLILWEGGNNELPFAVPDAHVVLADPLRPGDEVRYHPGETNLRTADDVIVNKENSADPADVETVVDNVREANPDATIRHADSVVTVDDPDAVSGARVLAVEDGPTLTHGGASRGAGTVAAEKYGAAELVDPRPDAVGTIADVFEEFDHLGDVLPAMGYSDDQVRDLEATIRNADADLVLAGTPHDLSSQVDVDVPIMRAHYRVALHDATFDDLLDAHAEALGLS